MIRALDDSNAVKLYKEYVSAFGLGWKVEKKGRSRVRAVCGDAAAVAVCVRGQGRERGMKHSRNSQQIQGDFQDFEAPAPAEPEYAGEVTMALPPVPMPDPNARRGLAQPAAKRSVLWSVLGILGEVLMTLAVVCALYVVWQMWWIGVQSEHTQVETRQSASWCDPVGGDSSKVAKAQSGDVPVSRRAQAMASSSRRCTCPGSAKGGCVTWSKARTRPNCRCMVWDIIRPRRCPVQSAISRSPATATAMVDRWETSTCCRRATRSSCVPRTTGTCTSTRHTRSSPGALRGHRR